MPFEAIFILFLDILTLAGWIVVLARSRNPRQKVALTATTAGIWFLGVGLGFHRLFEAGIVLQQGGVGDPAKLAAHLGDSLLIAAWSTQGALWLAILGIIGLALPQRRRNGEAVS